MNIENLIDVLTELRKVSINSSSSTIESIMHKYDMLFVGSKFNTIYSIELRHSLDKIFNYILSMDELNSMIPTACKTLNMKFEQLIAVEDIGQPNPAINYQITLWE